MYCHGNRKSTKTERDVGFWKWIDAVAGSIMLVFGGMQKAQELRTKKATDCCKCGLMNHPRKSFVEVVLWTMWTMEVVQEVSVNYFSSNEAREHSCDIFAKYVFEFFFLALSKEFSWDYWKILSNFIHRKKLRA